MKRLEDIPLPRFFFGALFLLSEDGVLDGRGGNGLPRTMGAVGGKGFQRISISGTDLPMCFRVLLLWPVAVMSVLRASCS